MTCIQGSTSIWAEMVGSIWVPLQNRVRVKKCTFKNSILKNDTLRLLDVHFSTHACNRYCCASQTPPPINTHPPRTDGRAELQLTSEPSHTEQNRKAEGVRRGRVGRYVRTSLSSSPVRRGAAALSQQQVKSSAIKPQGSCYSSLSLPLHTIPCPLRLFSLALPILYLQSKLCLWRCDVMLDSGSERRTG